MPAPANKFRLDRKGVREILRRTETAAFVNDYARQVTEAAGPNAEMVDYTSDRSAASVRVPASEQARRGALTRAAARVGLKVRNR